DLQINPNLRIPALAKARHDTPRGKRQNRVPSTILFPAVYYLIFDLISSLGAFPASALLKVAHPLLWPACLFQRDVTCIHFRNAIENDHGTAIFKQWVQKARPNALHR